MSEKVVLDLFSQRSEISLTRQQTLKMVPCLAAPTVWYFTGRHPTENIILPPGFLTNGDNFRGLARPTTAEAVPGPRGGLAFHLRNRDSNPTSFYPEFTNYSLPDGITRYLSHGASVSVPSEHTGYFFSGQRGKNWGPIASADVSANVSSRSLITVNLTDSDRLDWSNNTTPSMVEPRANAELVWIPVSDHGLLVALGGTANPESIYPGGLSKQQKSDSVQTSSTENYMK